MAIRAVVFDIGGVLEITPRTGVTEKWEAILHLQPGELDKKLYEVWRGGSIGTISLAQVHASIAGIMGMEAAQVDAMMEDIWVEYLGELNADLLDYFASLRPRFKTAIISNSFVGAREREQARYRFGDLTDLIIYSHEVGISKPDPQIYGMTCEQLGVAPGETIFLDDVEPYVAAARESGIHAVQFRDNAQAIAEIEALVEAHSNTG